MTLDKPGLPKVHGDIYLHISKEITKVWTKMNFKDHGDLYQGISTKVIEISHYWDPLNVTFLHFVLAR